MPVYAYKGVTESGKSAKGSVSAESLRVARAKMRQEGIFLTEIGESSGQAAVAAAPGTGVEESESRWNLRFELPVRIPTMELALATRQLATLVGARIPLVESLTALVEQVEHAKLKLVMAEVREKVNEGASLADAMEGTGHFDSLYVNMIRAGEAGGALHLVLARVADYLEDQVRLTSKVTSILVYPIVMLLFAMGVVGVLVSVVLPQITTLLLSLNQPLPFYTRWVIAGSEFVREWWWAIALLLIGAVAAVRAAIKTERGRAAYDRFRLRIPVFGRIIRVVAIARFARTLSTLLASGVGIVRSLDIAQFVANNSVIGQAIQDARMSIIEGQTLAAPLRSSGEFPPLVTTMIEVGERGGELEAMLSKVAETYDEQVETTVGRLTSLLEPMLILLMVGIVLVIILATLTPLLQITNSIS